MSLLGQIAVRGSTVTVKRATPTNTAGGATNLAWAAVTGLTGVKMLFDAPGDREMQRIFGQETRTDVRAFCAQALDVQRGDGILVTDGWLAGQNFQVMQPLAFDQNRSHAHKELGLISTPETFA